MIRPTTTNAVNTGFLRYYRILDTKRVVLTDDFVVGIVATPIDNHILEHRGLCARRERDFDVFVALIEE